MKDTFLNQLQEYGLQNKTTFRNPSPAVLYEEALKYDPGTKLSSSGALVAYSGEKTGRSPKDKRVVKNPESRDHIWWGEVNIPLEDDQFLVNRERAVDYLNTRERLYVIDGYAGWDNDHQIKVRVVCSRPYHALFMHNMLIRPTEEQLKSFGKPDMVIYNAGAFPANKKVKGVDSNTCVSVNFERGEFVILGTEYAGEMKKGVFTVMNYLMPRDGVLSMHCSVNEGEDKAASIFFGLSGTGKTTLSADPKRKLIGDDEHCWTEQGLFNIEGGCYAKTINLSKEKEPEIYHAIKFGSLLENVKLDPENSSVDYDDTSITENTRCSYPLEHMDNVKLPAVCGQPNNIIFLTADAFGVLPPVSKLDPEQVKYFFICGYTSKLAGTEDGVVDPEATFSPCYGAAFMVWHPTKYADMLVEKMKKNNCEAWLVNTGWTGGAYGTGSRISLPHTRSIIDAIHDGSLAKEGFTKDPIFSLSIPSQVNKVPKDILDPKNSWSDKAGYDNSAKRLAKQFEDYYSKYK